MKVRGFLLAVSFAVFSVGGHSSRGAEDSSRAAADAKPAEILCHCAGADTPAAANISRILAEPLKTSGLDFTEEPLESVVNYVQSEYNLPIQVDEPALENAGITRDEPVSMQVTNVSLRSALRLLLKSKNLTYIIRDEVIIITTPEVAEANLVTCVYDVHELVDSMGGEHEIKNLANVIETCTAPETWATKKGGEAQVKTLRPGLLVISQTQAVHEEVAELLAAIRATLRRSAALPAGRGMGMIDGGRGGYGMSEGGMGEMEGGGRGGYGGRGGGMEGGYGGGRGGEMGMEPTPAEETPVD